MSKRAPRRRRFTLTRQGKGYVFVTVGVGVAAVNTGNNLLYLILGLLLSLLLVSGTLSDLALYRVRARRRLPVRLYVGRPHAVEVTLENRKRVLPSFSLEVREEGVGAAPGLGGHPPEAQRAQRARAQRGHPPKPTPPPPFHGRGAYVVRVPAADHVTVTSTLTPERRGLHQLGMLLVTTRYPFGLIEKVSRRGHPEEVLVYPEVHDVALPAFPPHQLGLAEASSRRGHGPDTLGLRAHRVEDEARDIHWRRSASFGRLVSRERAAESDRSLTLALDERPPADPALRAAWDAAFEVAISECASLAVASLAHGISVAIRTEASESPRVDAGGVPDPLLRYLALLQPATTRSATALATAPTVPQDQATPAAAPPPHTTLRTASLVLRVPVDLAAPLPPVDATVTASGQRPARGGRAA